MKDILIIEDDKNLRINIGQVFEMKGYTVHTANDGIEGLKAVKSVSPDIIICDIMMPGMDGFQVKRKLSEDESLNSIPFIFLTAKAEIKDIREGMNSGADDYIIKPFKSEELVKSVETRLKRITALKETDPAALLKADKKPETARILSGEDSILLNEGNKPQYIKIGNILCIVADGNYTEVFLSDGSSIKVRKLIKGWMKILPEKKFFRARKSAVINLDFVTKIENWYSRTFLGSLRGHPEKIVVSQRMTAKLKALLTF